MLTSSTFEPGAAGCGRARLVALPEGALLLEGRPVWSRVAIGKLVVVSALLPLAVWTFSLISGPSGGMLAFVGMLWLSPWLALTAGRRLARQAGLCQDGLRHRLRRAADGCRLGRTSALTGSLTGALTGSTAATAGGSLRLRGRVLAGPGFVSASGRVGCVLACYAGLVRGRESREGWTEVHALPRCRLLVGEDVVELALDGARYLERHLSPVRQLHEQTIAEGDEVEVLGSLARTVDPDGGGYRTPGLKLVLAGDDRRPLLLRRPEPSESSRTRRSSGRDPRP